MVLSETTMAVPFERRRRIGPYRRDAADRWHDTRTGRFARTSSVKSALTRERRARGITTTTPGPRDTPPKSKPTRPGPSKRTKRTPRRERDPPRGRQGPKPHDPRPGPTPRQTAPQKGRAVAHNPGSPSFERNRAYQRHRGYYYKDRSGRWRTPDGKIVAGQEKGVVEQRDGTTSRTFFSRKAWEYNQRRADELRARDATNLLRRIGVKDAKLSDARRAIRDRQAGVSPREATLAYLSDEAQRKGGDAPRKLGTELASARTGRRRWRIGGS